MKQQILWALMCGLVIPGLLMMIAARLEEVPQQETQATQSTQLETVQETQVSLTVLSADGAEVQMELEEYLVGVLLAEMPVNFELEALKSQAVVARTYACKRLSGSKHETAQVCMDSTCCQGYLSPEDYLRAGGKEASIEKVGQAVLETSGLVLTWQGELIDATYFSCSGGSTEDAVAVWGQDVPYLQAVESPGEEEAPRHLEEVTFTAAEFSALTGCGGTGNPADWFGAVTYTSGGGVDTIQICARTYTGLQLRSLLTLRSTAFSISVAGDTITIQTKGSGHRVGMSQYGAQAMAQSGNTCAQILAHYYQGTTLEPLGDVG